MPAVAEQKAAQGDHGLSPPATPARVPFGCSLLHTGLDHGLTSRLNGATADGQTALAKSGIIEATAMVEKIDNGLTNGFGEWRASRIKEAGLLQEVAQLAAYQPAFGLMDPKGGIDG